MELHGDGPTSFVHKSINWLLSNVYLGLDPKGFVTIGNSSVDEHRLRGCLKLCRRDIFVNWLERRELSERSKLREQPLYFVYLNNNLTKPCVVHLQGADTPST
jgi:hypothetical protein